MFILLWSVVLHQLAAVTAHPLEGPALWSRGHLPHHYERNGSNVDPFQTFTIAAPDGSIRASFIALGASMTNLFVRDRDGEFRDIVAGCAYRTVMSRSAGTEAAFAVHRRQSQPLSQ